MGVADELYSLPPDEFTAARDAAARSARDSGDREVAAAVKQFRRPSIGAWLVNQLVRTHPDEVDELLDLGAALRDAQDALDGAELRTLSKQRHEVIRGLSDLAHRVAAEQGQNIADAAQREFEATFDAALADEAAAEAVRTGRLMRSLEPSGLDRVDLSGAVASPEDTPLPRAPKPKKTARTDEAVARKRKQDQKAEQQRAERELEHAEHELHDRDDRAAAARDSVSSAKARVEELDAQLDEARAALTAAQAERKDAEQALKQATRARDAAERAVQTARRRRE